MPDSPPTTEGGNERNSNISVVVDPFDSKSVARAMTEVGKMIRANRAELAQLEAIASSLRKMLEEEEDAA